MRVHGRIGGREFTSSVMPAGGGRLALSASKAMMKSAGVGVGQSTGRDHRDRTRGATLTDALV